MSQKQIIISDFNRGLWIGVEFLILDVDQPSYAKELVNIAGISLEEAVEIVKETNHQPHKIIDTLIKEKTWKIKINS